MDTGGNGIPGIEDNGARPVARTQSVGRARRRPGRPRAAVDHPGRSGFPPCTKVQMAGSLA